MLRHAILSIALLSLGCAPDRGASAANQTESGSYTFVDANADAPLSQAARKQLQQALRSLADVAKKADTERTRELASETLARITSGDVLIGSLEGARGIDRWHMCKDFDLAACEGPPTDDPEWIGDDELATTLAENLDGYMWGNRLYFASASEMESDMLAATLVHEVNHVANRSECSYYADIDSHAIDDTNAYIEEFRAFLSECFYLDDAVADIAACGAQAGAHVDEYGFEPDLASVLPNETGDANESPSHIELARLIIETSAFGELIPAAELWNHDFDACPR
jgi:broad specificity phosphatase PhoE